MYFYASLNTARLLVWNLVRCVDIWLRLLQGTSGGESLTAASAER